MELLTDILSVPAFWIGVAVGAFVILAAVGILGACAMASQSKREY